MNTTCLRAVACWFVLSFGLIESSIAQQGTWAIKTGIYSSRQRQQNILTVEPVPDTTFFIGSNITGGYGRATFNLMACYDLLLNSRIAMQVGAGYRQKGFRSETVYRQDEGYAVHLPSRTLQDNLFHYASSELSFQFRTAPRPAVGYLRLGQRLDYLMGFKSAFWGDNYGYLTQFDYNVFASIGVERALGRKIIKPKTVTENIQPIFSRPSALFLEIEGTPLLFNISKSNFPTTPLALIVDQQGNPLAVQPMRVQKIVRNTGFGVVVGVRF